MRGIRKELDEVFNWELRRQIDIELGMVLTL